MPMIAKTTGNRRAKKDERRSIDTKMYDTRSKHIEGAKGIKT